jgi:hypothetical protein
MATTLKFLPGSMIRWRARRFIVVDYADIDAIIARELGKRKLERIPVLDAKPDRTPGDQKAWTPDLVSIPAEAWKRAGGHLARTHRKGSFVWEWLWRWPSARPMSPIGTMMHRCIVDGGKHRDSLLPAAAAARPKRLRCTVADQH